LRQNDIRETTVAKEPGHRGEPDISVCRGKARFLRGCKSLPARAAPAGSNRTRREGNALCEPVDEKGRGERPAPCGSTGVVTPARTQREPGQHGRPHRAVEREINRRPVKARPGAAGSRMGQKTGKNRE